jgi:hypothetical protein
MFVSLKMMLCFINIRFQIAFLMLFLQNINDNPYEKFFCYACSFSTYINRLC